MLKFNGRFRRAHRLHPQNLIVKQVNQFEAGLACSLIQDGFLLDSLLNSVDDASKIWFSFSGLQFVLLQNIEFFIATAMTVSNHATNYFLLVIIELVIRISLKNSASVTAHRSNRFYTQTQLFRKNIKLPSSGPTYLNLNSEYRSCLCFRIVGVNLQDYTVSQSRRPQYNIYRH